MAYDSNRHRVVLFGGTHLGYVSTLLGDTWEWDGTDWTDATPSRSPSSREGHAMVYDVARQRVVLFGGIGAEGRLDDVWEWDGREWRGTLSATESQ